MSDPEIMSASAPVGGLGDRKRTDVIKVQNEDELRLAQMGRFAIPCDWEV
jgi:choline transport protein